MPRRREGPDRWASWPTDELLRLRVCDLGVGIEGTWLEEPLAKVHEELRARRIRLKPHAWLTDEWCCPDGVPGFGVPFFLAHPRLVRIEREHMLEAEGSARRDCLMLMRHEIGHALQHAFQLQRRRRWQRTFGLSSSPYPDSYRPNPASKRYVVHLDGWYAQSHPVEDFAETFAVWLNPRSAWRKKYANWPALAKLEYVDELMNELAGQEPVVRSRARPYKLSSITITLEEHYRRKQEHYGRGYSGTYDRDLDRLFAGEPGEGEAATAYFKRHRSEVRDTVVRWTGEHSFTVDQIMKQMIGRCRAMKLRTCEQAPPSTTDLAVLLTVHSMTYLHRVREWHAM